jgi:hypothetical protein
MVKKYKSIRNKSMIGGEEVGIFDISNLKWWIPKPEEILIFACFVFLTYWLSTIYKYNTVENQVIQTSRCYADNHALKAGNQQYATATNARNAPLYTVSYNLAAKQSSLECACNSGTTVNTFTNIPIFDLTTNSVTIVPQKQCTCDTALLSASPNVYFTGYPGIVKFMNTASISANPLDDPNIDTTYFLPTSTLS